MPASRVEEEIDRRPGIVFALTIVVGILGLFASSRSVVIVESSVGSWTKLKQVLQEDCQGTVLLAAYPTSDARTDSHKS